MRKLETCLQSFQEKKTRQASDVIIFFQVPAQSNLRIAEFYEPRASTITFLPVHVDVNRKYSRAAGAVKVKYTGKPEGREAFRTQVMGCDPRWRVDKMTFERRAKYAVGDFSVVCDDLLDGRKTRLGVIMEISHGPDIGGSAFSRQILSDFVDRLHTKLGVEENVFRTRKFSDTTSDRILALSELRELPQTTITPDSTKKEEHQ